MEYEENRYLDEVYSDSPNEEEEDKTHYYSGLCEKCECEWNGLEEQNLCPKCGNLEVDLIEEEKEGDGIL